MSSDSCRYDCSEHPESVSPYADISGIGVVISYVTTAGIVVAIITFYYLFAYDPTSDPFRMWDDGGSDHQSTCFRPNPVELKLVILGSKLPNWLQTRKFTKPPNPRLQASCIKCVQSMSDLQILTGISILISGYLQLRCGLSSYHWQVLVYLAWFSSLTHLTCLTFLRNYLYNKQGERAWRLVAMTVLLIMLLVAMVPTGNYNWSIYDTQQPTPTPGDYAICYFKRAESVDNMAFVSMVISVLLLVLGFVSRVVRLHKSLSVDIIGRARDTVSKFLRKTLLKLYKKLKVESSPKCLRRTMLYRPFLAVFLALRVGLDAWCSMVVEIWWLVASYIWGILKLFSTLGLRNGGNSDWTFGQVVPVVLLAAPLLATFEYLYPGRHQGALRPIAGILTAAEPTPSDPRPQTTQHPAAAVPADSPLVRTETLEIASERPEDLRDHPDRDYYKKSAWIEHFLFFVIADMVGLTIRILILSSLGKAKLIQLLIPTAYIYNWLPINQLLTLVLFILFSLLIEDFSLGQGGVVKPQFRKNLVVIQSSLLFSYLIMMQFTPEAYLWVAISFYFLCCIFYRLFG